MTFFLQEMQLSLTGILTKVLSTCQDDKRTRVWIMLLTEITQGQ